MNVSLTPKLEALVKRKIESGLYTSASEVVREALRLLEERDALRVVKLESLKKDIAAGVAELDAGRARALDVGRIKKKGRSALGSRSAK